MGKASKRERQKINRDLRAEEKAKAESRACALRTAKTLGLILIIPAVVIIAILVNHATTPDTYTAKITVAVDGVKKLPGDGVIDVSL